MIGLTAIILAGGKGSRMAPWPAPKCLMPVKGTPIIHWIYRHLISQGDIFERIVVCTGYRADDVVSSMAGLHVCFSSAGEDATMMERLFKARQEYKIEGPCLVLYGDELADVSVSYLSEDHKNSKSLMTMTVWDYRLPFGVYEKHNGGDINDRMRVKVNIGFALVEPEAWTYGHGCSGLSDFFNRLHYMPDGTSAVNVYEHTGKRVTINSLKELEEAEAMM